MTRYLHVPTMIGLIVLYLAGVAMLAFLPHQDIGTGVGKMEAHQLFAKAGRIASFGVINCTLVDWYMLGPTMEDNIGPYNRVVAHSVKVLTPIFIMWMLVVSALAAAAKNRHHMERQNRLPVN